MTKSVEQVERTLIKSGLHRNTACSSAAVIGNQVWTAGVPPVRADGSVPKNLGSQVRTSLENLESSLRAAGAGLGDIVKVNAYVANIRLLPEIDEVYREVMGHHGLPPRTIVEVGKFRGKALVEFDAVAVLRDRG